jgi:hypothetical protein
VSPRSLIILAADISPIDVLSHIPVLCEDSAVPYVFVSGKAELGSAAGTKRPTSVVLVATKTAKGACVRMHARGRAGARGTHGSARARRACLPPHPPPSLRATVRAGEKTAASEIEKFSDVMDEITALQPRQG